MLYFHPLFGEDSHFDLYLSEGLKPPTGRGFFLWFRVTWTHEELPGCYPRLATVPDLPIMWLESMGIQRPLKCFEDMDWWVIMIYSNMLYLYIYISGWWFQIFFIFTPIWGRFPIWLIFFKWVETTKQICVFIVLKEFSLASMMESPLKCFNSGSGFFCYSQTLLSPTNQQPAAFVVHEFPWQELLDTYARLLVHCLEAACIGWVRLIPWIPVMSHEKRAPGWLGLFFLGGRKTTQLYSGIIS